MPKFFVALGESKKICTANKEDLLDAVRLKFDIPNTVEVILQTYCAEFEDWLDTETQDLPDGGKVNVVIKTSCLSGSARREDDNPNASVNISQPDQDFHQQALSGDNTSEKSCRWPGRFVLPVQKFGHTLTSTLAKKQPLTPALSSALMDVLYCEVTMYTFYPTSSQYNEVIQSLVAEYPHLCKMKIGDTVIEGDSCVRKWKCTLADKFRNMRKRRDRLVPEVATKYRGKRAAPTATTVNTSTSRPKKILNQWGVVNFLPDRPTTEDDASIERAIDWLQTESSKRRPDMSGIKLRMELTFADRRRMVVNEMSSISAVRRRYPALFMEEEVLNEFHRLTDMNLDEKFLAGMNKYGQSLLDKAASPHDDKQRVIAAISASRIQADRNRLTAYGALLVLPSLLNETVSNILCPENLKPDHVSTPLLLHSGDVLDAQAEFRIVADNEDVTQPLDLFQGVECLLATYYVFNIAYPKACVSTLTFIQKAIVGLTDQTSNPRKVTSLMVKLCR